MLQSHDRHMAYVYVYSAQWYFTQTQLGLCSIVVACVLLLKVIGEREVQGLPSPRSSHETVFLPEKRQVVHHRRSLSYSCLCFARPI